MVAVIHSSRSLRNALNYNEQKVKEQIATCLAAVNYPKDLSDLSFHQKLSRLENLAALNVRTRVNSVHISLNFDPSEKLSEALLTEIAATYLEKIGFAHQPYLLYQHHDSGHPHVHIVTTNIKPSGKRIELHNLGKIQSEKARKEVEVAFGLVRPGDSKQGQTYDLKPVNIQKAQYGRSQTKRAISNILNGILTNYKYTSIAELNAVLQQYNVMAERGSENSRVFQNRGLIYRIVNDQGQKIGVPIKASDFHNKPTLPFLEERFKLNEAARDIHKVRVKNAIDIALLRQPTQSLQGLIKALQKDGIHTVLRQNAERIIYGITYVDHRTRCVFNGSDLGKAYSANGLQKRCSLSDDTQSDKHQLSRSPEPYTSTQPVLESGYHPEGKDDLIDILLQPEQISAYVPNQLTRKKGKTKKKQIAKRL